MLRIGIANDIRYLRWCFWRWAAKMLMRAWCWAWLKSAKLDPFARVNYGE